MYVFIIILYYGSLLYYEEHGVLYVQHSIEVLYITMAFEG